MLLHIFLYTVCTVSHGYYIIIYTVARKHLCRLSHTPNSSMHIVSNKYYIILCTVACVHLYGLNSTPNSSMYMSLIHYVNDDQDE